MVAIPESERIGQLAKQAGRPKTLIECYELREKLFQDAMQAQDPLVRARLAHAWVEVTERQRILRNKPLPGALRPEPKNRGKRVKGILRDAPQVHDVSIAQLPSANPEAFAVIESQPVNGPSNG